MSAAQKQAESLIHDGRAEQESALEALRGEVDRLTKRRDAISAQLGALREVVSGFNDEG